MNNTQRKLLREVKSSLISQRAYNRQEIDSLQIQIQKLRDVNDSIIADLAVIDEELN